MTIQQQKIYNLLKSHVNEWVGLPLLLSLGVAQYNSRILELRRMGYRIENKQLGIVNGQKHTAFRLVENIGEQRKFAFAGECNPAYRMP